jgi:hypothetical protein
VNAWNVEAEADSTVLVSIVAPQQRIVPGTAEAQNSALGAHVVANGLKCLPDCAILEFWCQQLKWIVQVVKPGRFSAAVSADHVLPSEPQENGMHASEVV